MERQPRRAASIAAMSIFFMPIIAVAGSDQMQKPIELTRYRRLHQRRPNKPPRRWGSKYNSVR